MASIIAFLLATFTIGGGAFLVTHDPNLVRAIRFEIAPWASE